MKALCWDIALLSTISKWIASRGTLLSFIKSGLLFIMEVIMEESRDQTQQNEPEDLM